MKEPDLTDWAARLPDNETIHIFGLSQLQEKQSLGEKAFKTIADLAMLTRAVQGPQPGYEDLELDLENISYKISLQKAS